MSPLKIVKTRRIFHIAVLIGSLAGPNDSSAAEQTRPPPTPRIRYQMIDLRAFLFYDRTGKTGERNIAEPYRDAEHDERGPPRDLYHAMEGQESESGPSNFTVVIATLRKPTFLSHKATGHLRLIAKNRAGRVLFSETRSLARTGSAFADPDHNVPFVIPRTECVSIILEASLEVRDGKVVSNAAEKRLVPFLCHD